MEWLSDFVDSILQEMTQNALQVEKPISETCKPENQKQSGSLQVSGFTGQKQQSRKKVCETKSQIEDLSADPCECVEHEQQKQDHYMAQVRREQADVRARHEAWRKTLRPAPKHKLARLLPEEERHLQIFIRKMLIVAPRRGDNFYHMSGSDLWSLRAAYEKESGYTFSTRIDFFDYYIAQATGANVMDGKDGQRWLIGVSY